MKLFSQKEQDGRCRKKLSLSILGKECHMLERVCTISSCLLLEDVHAIVAVHFAMRLTCDGNLRGCMPSGIFVSLVSFLLCRENTL